jgi:hypothetical protein
MKTQQLRKIVHDDVVGICYDGNNMKEIIEFYYKPQGLRDICLDVDTFALYAVDYTTFDPEAWNARPEKEDYLGIGGWAVKEGARYYIVPKHEFEKKFTIFTDPYQDPDNVPEGHVRIDSTTGAKQYSVKEYSKEMTTCS